MTTREFPIKISQLSTAPLRPAQSPQSYRELFLFSLVFLIVFYNTFPGFLSTDSKAQLLEALSGQFNNWHSPLMDVLWRQLNHIYGGPAPYLFISLSITTGALYGIFRFVVRDWSIRFLALLFVMFYPTNFIISSWVTKDGLFRSSILFGFAITAAAVMGENRRWSYRLRVVAAFLTLVFAVDVRPDGIAAAFPILLWLCSSMFSVQKNRLGFDYPRTIKIVSLSLVLAFVTLRLVKFVDYAICKNVLHPEQVIMVDDLASISIERGELLIPGRLLKSQADLKTFRQKYTPWNIDYLFWDVEVPLVKMTSSEPEFKELFKAWLSAVSNNPAIYLRHRAVKYFFFQGLNRGFYGAAENNSPADTKDGFGGLDSSHVYIHPTLLNRIENYTYRSKLFGIFRRPFIYPIISLGCLLGAVRSSGWSSPISQLVGVLAASSYLYEALYFFVDTNTATRFVSWPIFAATLSLALFVGNRISGYSKSPAD